MREDFSPIRTPRLALRLADAADAAPLAGLMTGAISARLASWGMPWTAERMAARIADWRPIGLPCVVERPADGALIGWVHALRRHDDQARAAMGWWCAEAHRGQGYLREAAAALLPAAFEHLAVPAIEAAAQPDNHASFAVMHALGMRPAGERVIHAAARGREERVIVWERWRDGRAPAGPEIRPRS